MRIRARKDVVVAVAAVVTILVAEVVVSRAQVLQSELPNFHQVNPKLYRGGQPKPGGLQKLRAMGVKTVINLRGADDLSRAEGKEAGSMGLRYYDISLPGLSGPSDAEVARVLAIINAPESQPVFVHCHHGRDRTGMIIACYRISHDGWTAAQAKEEASRYGLSWSEIGMKHYIENYYARLHPRRQAVRE
jgi:tyrosine-protein phosphatase SIW14